MILKKCMKLYKKNILLIKVFSNFFNIINFKKLLPRIRKYIIWHIYKPTKVVVLNKTFYLMVNNKFKNKNFYGYLPSKDLYAYRKNYNLTEQKLIFSKVRDNYNCIDIGSNIGFYSYLFLLANGFNGNIYSFEACSFTFKKLKKNFINYKNVKLFNGFVGIEKNNMIIDQFIKEKINFIKIDIDGTELLALKSCKNILKKYKPDILFEASETSKRDFNISYIETLKYLNDLRYRVFEFKLKKNMIEYKIFKRSLKKNEVINLYAKSY